MKSRHLPSPTISFARRHCRPPDRNACRVAESGDACRHRLRPNRDDRAAPAADDGPSAGHRDGPPPAGGHHVQADGQIPGVAAIAPKSVANGAPIKCHINIVLYGRMENKCETLTSGTIKKKNRVFFHLSSRKRSAVEKPPSSYVYDRACSPGRGRTYGWGREQCRVKLLRRRGRNIFHRLVNPLPPLLSHIHFVAEKNCVFTCRVKK